ncbi:MAG: XdhC family protein, partial [Syntrophomonas sp.]
MYINIRYYSIEVIDLGVSDLMRMIADKQDNQEELALVTVISSTFMNNCPPGAMMVVDQYGQVVGSDIEDSLLQERV